jgi:antitoxin VapB
MYIRGVNEVESGSVFKSNTSQAVRLPKPVALPESVKRVDIIPLGRARLIVPAGEGWDSWFDGEGVTEDFMNLRDQPEDQERESF